MILLRLNGTLHILRKIIHIQRPKTLKNILDPTLSILDLWPRLQVKLPG